MFLFCSMADTLSAPIPESPTPAAEDPAAARTARHLRLLERMVEIGMGLLDDLRDPASGPAVERGLTYTRVTRAIRLTMALEERLANPPAEAPKPDLKPVVPSTPPTWVERTAEDVRDEAKETIKALVEELRYDKGDEVADDLRVAVGERLDEFDDEDFDTLSMAEILGIVCKDLGLEPEWEQWIEEELVDLDEVSEYRVKARREAAAEASPTLSPSEAPHVSPSG